MLLKDALYKLFGTRWCILQLVIGMWFLEAGLKKLKVCLACS